MLSLISKRSTGSFFIYFVVYTYFTLLQAGKKLHGFNVGANEAHVKKAVLLILGDRLVLKSILELC